jgi:hypothetical protein
LKEEIGFSGSTEGPSTHGTPPTGAFQCPGTEDKQEGRQCRFAPMTVELIGHQEADLYSLIMLDLG